uniref:Uncharacterized protein n=1 Tax=uncultured prokaryote TaxID=198431 RepID=A0A0H5QDC4_9ZZZZ|nr:hypothetical protein [uncultured prokaryote]
MREVITRWGAAGAAPEMLSVMNFDDSVPILDVRERLSLFWGGISDRLANSTTWSIDRTGREFNEATGQTTGLWVDTTLQEGTGSGNPGSPVPNAAMALVRWRTGTYRLGREVRGRTFIPGFANDEVANGQLSPAAMTALIGAAAFYIGSNPGLMIWSRPKVGTPGAAFPVTTAEIWGEFATQRKRRA